VISVEDYIYVDWQDPDVGYDHDGEDGVTYNNVWCALDDEIEHVIEDNI
jgi:hypothetical protein